MKALALAALVVPFALLGCSAGGDGGGGDGGDDDAAPAPFAPSSSAVEEVDLAATRVCELVRRGVDAFNGGDVESTIELFEQAVPLAEDLAADKPSDDTDLLLEAVRFYAQVPAEDYAEANATDPEFQLYKAFTLDACAYQGPPEPSETGIPA